MSVPLKTVGAQKNMFKLRFLDLGAISAPAEKGVEECIPTRRFSGGPRAAIPAGRATSLV